MLDEPFSGLDPLIRDEFMERLLRQAGEMTILISSHELAEIEGVTTHVGYTSPPNAIALAFNPQMGQFKLPAGAAAEATAGLYVPLQVSGIPPGAIVLMDRAKVRITDVTGRTVYQDRSNLSVDGVGSLQEAQLEVHQPDGSSAPRDVYQRIFLPAAIYEKLGGEAVRMEVKYSLTLFRSGKTFSLPAYDGHGSLDGLGTCATRIDSEGDDVQLRCVNTTRPPSCFTAFLEYMPSGLRNPETHSCSADYSPSPFRVQLWPDALTRFGGESPFFDRSGLIRYPVDGSKLPRSRLMIQTYEPREHFTRQLTTSTIMLSGFTAVRSGVQLSGAKRATASMLEANLSRSAVSAGSSGAAR